MEKKENKQLFALLGRNISYSFSRKYFTDKFKQLDLFDHEYVNFDIENIEDFPSKIKAYQEKIKGMNVTIPYKQDIFNYLDEIEDEAKNIGAVNTIKFKEDGSLVGYNTDVYGFQKSLEPLLKDWHKKALILGTGGAAKAIAYVLRKLGIDYYFVSRKSLDKKTITYEEVDEKIVTSHLLIINCTPLGTYPNIEACPEIPYAHISKEHLLYDLIYNPEETLFLRKGSNRGAAIKNGMEMLEQQAEKAWAIWNA